MRVAVKNIFLLTSMVFLLSACGGGGSEESSEQAVSPPVIPEITPTPSNTINLSGSTAETTVTETKVAGKPTTDRGLIDSVAANARASISIRNFDEIVEGNITFELTASDDDGISSLNLVLPSVNKNITLCNQACGTNFERSVIGFSPNFHGVLAGDLRLEIWITDKLNNQILAGATAIRWQPYQIIGTTAKRDLENISLSWQVNNDLNRYNVYVATEAGITPSNISQLENGQQYLGLSSTSFSFANVFVDKSYQVLITGVDGSGESGFAVPLNIAPVDGELNFAPEATNDQFQIDEDTPLQGNVLTNDSDQYQGVLRTNTTPVVQPQHGTVEITENGQFVYTPKANFNGIDAFSYQVVNQLGMTDTALVEIIINAINDAPTALDNNYNITRNGSLSVPAPGLLANDSDIDSNSLSVDPVAVTLPTKGTLTLNIDGSFDYQGDANLQGVDSFQYRIYDSSGAQAIANVTIAGLAENNSPMAVNDNYNLSEDSTLVVNADLGLLANDSDPDNDSFTLDERFLISPNHGQLLLATDGSFSYIPDANYYGIDKFQYQIVDSLGATATASATLTINSVADNPVAQNDVYQFQYNQRLDVNTQDGLLSNDINVDVGELSINTTPVENVKSGTLTLNSDGSFSYQPNTNALDVDSFSYSVFNQQGLSATAQVILSKAGSNTPARAVNDQYSLLEDSLATQLDVLANDIDVDGDAISITNISTTTGTARIINNKIEFTPPANFFGEVKITYSISDGLTNNPPTTATAIATITVLPINDTPIALADTTSIIEDSSPVLIDVLANDSDIDGDSLSIVNTTTNLGFVDIVDNKVQYSPIINSNGVALVTYTITDGNGGTATANLVINISAVNDAPSVSPDIITLIEDSPATLIDVLANDSDVDGDTLTIINVSTSADNATVFNNQIRFTPVANDNGIIKVNYIVSDGITTASSTLTINITPVNDTPIANSDSATIEEDQISSIDVLTNDSDIEGDALTITNVIASVGNAAVVNNQIEYTPASDFNGTATVNYTVSDGTDTAAGELTITVSQVNDTPIALDQSFSIGETATNGDAIGTLVASDIENHTLSFSLSSGDIGLFTLNSATGLLTANGVSPFDYETSTQHTIDIDITDDGTPTTTTTITVTVTVLDEDDPLEPVEDSNFGRPLTGQLELANVFSDGEFTDSIVLNNNLYFVGYTNNVDKDIMIASYTSAGAINTAFDGDGIKVIDLNQDEEATAIVSGNGDLFIAFSSSNGSNTEACLMKISTTGIVSNNSGDANTGIRCTTLSNTAVTNDLEFTDNKIQAVGHFFNGQDKDSLWLKYDAVTLAFEDSPKIVDVSGADRDDEAYAINNFGNSDLMVVGSVSSLLSGKNSVIRHLQPNGNDKIDFNGGSPLLLDLSENNLDDELQVIGGIDAPNFTAYLGGYKRRSNSEKEAILTAVDNLGNIQLSIGDNGIETYNIDSDSDEKDGGATITGIDYEPINNQLILSGSTGVEATDIDQNINMFSARVLIGTAELDNTYADSGINIISTVLGDQIASSLSIDENDTLWLAGRLNDASNEPFITAVNGQQSLFTDFEEQGYASLNSLSIVANDQSMNVLQLTTGAHAGKFILASRAEYAASNKLVLTRFTANGLVDTSFSLDGSKALNINVSTDDFKLLELSDGSIVIAGTKLSLGDKVGFVTKVNQEGIFDYAFATNGIYSTTALAGTDVTFLDVARDSSDNIVAVGSITTSGVTRSFATMLKDSGSLEGSFGISGEFIGNTNEIFESLYIDANKDIFVGGKLVSGNESQLLMLKWNSDADQEFRYLDSRSVPDVANRAAKILADPLANLYLVGNEGNAPNQAVIVKLLSSGNKDVNFATSGVGQYSLVSNGDSTVSDAALDSSGNLILTGMSNSQGVLARVLANGSIDTSFGPSSMGYYEGVQCGNTQQFTSMLLQNDTQVIVSVTCFDGTSKNVSLSKFNFYTDGVEP